MPTTCVLHLREVLPCRHCARLGSLNDIAADELAARASVRPKHTTTSGSGNPALAPTPIQGWKRNRKGAAK